MEAARDLAQLELRFVDQIPWRYGPAGAFEQEYTVLRNSLFNNALSDDTGTVKITYINLVVRSKAILGRKSTRKLISEINVRLLDRSQVFLLGKTVGSCTDDVPFTTQTRLHFDVILPLWGRRGPR